MRHLKTARAAVALALFAPSLLAFVDFGRVLPAGAAAVVSRSQLVPALLRVALPPLLAIAAVTLLFGRVYCSTLCPLGTLQDACIRLPSLGRHGKRRRFRFRFSAPRARYQFALAVAVFALALAGILLPLDLLEPWSIFGRASAALGQPAVALAVNGISDLLGALHVYAVAPVTLPRPAPAALAIALVSLAGIGWLAAVRGRLWCNLLCPAGAVLRLLSWRPLVRVALDEEKCDGCGVCEKACKAGCIDAKARTVEASACVACFDCLAVCPRGGVKLTAAWPRRSVPAAQVLDAQRRTLLRSATVTVGALLLPRPARAAGQGEGAPSPAADPRDVRRPVTPPGSRDAGRFTSRCTACHLCVAACPTQVLRPSLLEYGLAGVLQPRLSYDAGACVYDCNRCGQVCPTSAIVALPLDERRLVQVGRARFVTDDCVVTKKGKACGACAEHCPTKAIQMVPVESHLPGAEANLRIPKVDEDLCIGCGACEHPCPVEPRKAIYVEARTPHGTAKKPDQSALENPLEKGKEFPF
jgi:ferredoxin